MSVQRKFVCKKTSLYSKMQNGMLSTEAKENQNGKKITLQMILFLEKSESVEIIVYITG